MKTIRVYLGGAAGLEDVLAGIQDLLVQLNRHFWSRGMEFVAALPGENATEADLAVLLYDEDFGKLPKEQFEEAYRAFKREHKPKIYVFFKEPSANITEELKAFRDSFEKKYGHFCCYFETVDAVKFQLVVQSLSFWQGMEAKDTLKVERGEVRLAGKPVANLANLSFAKLNGKRQSLLRQIDNAETEVSILEEQSQGASEDEDLQESLRIARVKRHNLKEELEQYDGFLCETAVFFAKESMKELDGRVRKARELFNHGQIWEANKLLDLPEMIEHDKHDAELFAQAREARVQNIQAFWAKAKLVMADASLAMNRRTDLASESYEHAIRIAREIRLEARRLAEILFDYAFLLQAQHRYHLAVTPYEEALVVYRRLAEQNPDDYRDNVALTQNNLAFLQRNLQQLSEAEQNLRDALEILRNLVLTAPEAYQEHLAFTLINLAVLHFSLQRFEEAEQECGEVLETLRRLTAGDSESHDSILASTLSNLAFLHLRMEYVEDAEDEYKKALRIWRNLAAVEPETYEEQVATTLINIANVLWVTGRLEEAVDPYEEAMDILHRLAVENPEAYDEHWASTLNDSASLMLLLQRLGEAETRYEAALSIRRRLTADNPEACKKSVARTLVNLANLHKDLNRFKEAEAEYREALCLDRELAQSHLEDYEIYVALDLHNLAELYEMLGENKEALVTAIEAVDAYEWCDAHVPGQFGNDLEEARVLVERLAGKNK